MFWRDSVGKFEIVYIDPPWSYYGSKTKDAAAGKHYNLMSQEEIEVLPVRQIMTKTGAAFVWATCPRLDAAVSTIEAWGLNYRGVAFVWVKARKDGVPIGAQGVPPTATKPTCELLLFATVQKRGRPFKLLSSKVPQVQILPRRAHSQKPDEFRQLIVELYGDRERVEIFARQKTAGWSVYGDEIDKF